VEETAQFVSRVSTAATTRSLSARGRWPAATHRNLPPPPKAPTQECPRAPRALFGARRKARQTAAAIRRFFPPQKKKTKKKKKRPRVVDDHRRGLRFTRRGPPASSARWCRFFPTDPTRKGAREAPVRRQGPVPAPGPRAATGGRRSARASGRRDRPLKSRDLRAGQAPLRALGP